MSVTSETNHSSSSANFLMDAETTFESMTSNCGTLLTTGGAVFSYSVSPPKTGLPTKSTVLISGN